MSKDGIISGYFCSISHRPLSATKLASVISWLKRLAKIAVPKERKTTVSAVAITVTAIKTSAKEIALFDLYRTACASYDKGSFCFCVSQNNGHGIYASVRIKINIFLIGRFYGKNRSALGYSVYFSKPPL